MLFDALLPRLYRLVMLAERLKKLRKDFGWTQVELAKRAGVSQQLITKIERGEVYESRKLPKLAAAFGLSAEQLVAALPEQHGRVATLPAHTGNFCRLGTADTSHWFHFRRKTDCWRHRAGAEGGGVTTVVVDSTNTTLVVCSPHLREPP